MAKPQQNPGKSGGGEKPKPATEVDRRNFAVRVAAGVIGALVGVVPLLAGLRFYFDPLTRRKAKADDAEMIRIATLDALPELGKPYRFPVIAVREDKWNKYPPAPIGAVFLRLDEKGKDPVAFTSVCPHLGCSVDVKGDEFKCPCHNSSWTLKGERINPESCPSPRDLDTLDVKMNGNEIWVAYKRFRGGIEDKIEE